METVSKIPKCQVAEKLLSATKAAALRKLIGEGTICNTDLQVASAQQTAQCGLMIDVTEVAKRSNNDWGEPPVYAEDYAEIEATLPDGCRACLRGQ